MRRHNFFKDVVNRPGEAEQNRDYNGLDCRNSMVILAAVREFIKNTTPAKKPPSPEKVHEWLSCHATRNVTVSVTRRSLWLKSLRVSGLRRLAWFSYAFFA